MEEEEKLTETRVYEVRREITTENSRKFIFEKIGSTWYFHATNASNYSREDLKQLDKRLEELEELD